MENNLHSKFNDYGTLVTVVSLLLIVVYATGKYDAWDALISIMGIWFGSLYLLKKAFFDRASKFLGSLIVSCGVGIFYKSVISIWCSYYSGVATTQCNICNSSPSSVGGGAIDPLLIYILVFALFLSMVSGKPKNA